MKKTHKYILLLVGVLLLYASHQDILYDSDQIAYLSGAKNLVENGKYLVNGKPDWRGVGYGHLLAIPFFLFGSGFQTGLYFSIFCAILTLIAVYKISQILLDAQHSLLVLLTLFPSFHFWRQSTTLMTEIPALCFLCWGLYFLLHFYQNWKRPLFYLACLHFGLAILIRPANIFVAIFFMPLFLKKKYWGDLVAGALLVGLLLSPQWIYNAIHFGGPLVSGYSQKFKPFDLSYFFTRDTVLRRPCFQMGHYILNILIKPSGFGLTWLPFLLLGITASFKKLNKNRLIQMLWLWILGYLVLISLYAYHDERFFVPLLPPLAILTILGFQKFMDWLFSQNFQKLIFIKNKSFSLFWLAWLPAFLISWTLIQASINLHANRYAALNWIKENTPPKAGLVTSEAYLGRFLTGLETLNYSKTWNQQASFEALKQFINSKDTLFVVLPEKRLYIVTEMNATSGYADVENWLNQNYETKSEGQFKSKLPWLLNFALVEKIFQSASWLEWPQEQYEIWRINNPENKTLQKLPEPVSPVLLSQNK